MPDTLKHLIAGLCSAGTSHLDYKATQKEDPNSREFAVCLLVGAIGAVAPDILEPPDNPNHRGFFHSRTCIGLLTWLGDAIIQNPTSSTAQRIATIGTVSGYGSHIRLDSSTPKGVSLA